MKRTGFRKVLSLGFGGLAAACLVAAPVAMAQDGSDGDDDGGDDQAVMTTAIGCVATYDLVLVRGLAGSQVADIQKAREQAREVYKQASGLNDDDTDADIAVADADLPRMLTNGNASLQEYRHICDDLLSDDQGGDDGPLPVIA